MLTARRLGTNRSFSQSVVGKTTSGRAFAWLALSHEGLSSRTSYTGPTSYFYSFTTHSLPYYSVLCSCRSRQALGPSGVVVAMSWKLGPELANTIKHYSG